MSSRARANRASASKRRRRSRAAARRRALVGAGVAIAAALALWPILHHAVREVTLPLRHEDIIRQQSRDKHLDPSLLAAVIFAESKFREDATSAAGAKGLMQITPATAAYIAHKSGGTAFTTEDLGDAQINISYGAYYLRYLLDRYGGNEALALAAYNAGEGNVDRWITESGKRGRAFRIGDIPFAETRAYVERVVRAQTDYRHEYKHELGF